MRRKAIDIAEADARHAPPPLSRTPREINEGHQGDCISHDGGSRNCEKLCLHDHGQPHRTIQVKSKCYSSFIAASLLWVQLPIDVIYTAPYSSRIRQSQHVHWVECQPQREGVARRRKPGGCRSNCGSLYRHFLLSPRLRQSPSRRRLKL